MKLLDMFTDQHWLLFQPARVPRHLRCDSVIQKSTTTTQETITSANRRPKSPKSKKRAKRGLERRSGGPSIYCDVRNAS